LNVQEAFHQKDTDYQIHNMFEYNGIVGEYLKQKIKSPLKRMWVFAKNYIIVKKLTEIKLIKF